MRQVLHQKSLILIISVFWPLCHIIAFWSVSWSVNAIVSVGQLSAIGNRTNQVRFNLLLSQADTTTTTSSWTTGPAMLIGWHCSWCMPTPHFIKKMANFAHSEMNQARFRNVQWLDTMREQGLWFPDAAPNGCVQSVSGPLQVPAYIAQNMDRLSSELMLNMW